MLSYPLYTEKTNCQDCYKCVRHCPVKAIKVSDNSASILPENCIFCGHCTEVCPVGAKKVVNDTKWVRHLIESGEKVIASIAPSWAAEFDMTDSEMVLQLKNLGFIHVSETAIGAEIITEKTGRMICSDDKRLHISSCCPSVVELIKKYYPEKEKNLIPLASPFVAHGRFLRKYYGKGYRVVFIGPCIAKKKEASDYPDIIDAALTFKELRDWMEVKSSDTYSEKAGARFVPHNASAGVVYPVDGGMISGLKKEGRDVSYMSFTGLKKVNEILSTIEEEQLEGKVFLELMACKEGCVNGPVSEKQISLVKKRQRILQRRRQTEHSGTPAHLYSVNVPGILSKSGPVEVNKYSWDEIKEALESVGKISEKDELNCGGCGYESCRDFAEAILDGKAERSMCVSYMRKVAHNKASVLLQRIPYGVVMFDENLKIIECNRIFASMLGEETQQIFDAKPGMNNADLSKLIGFSKLFSNFISGGGDDLEKDVRDGNNLFRVSCFAIQKQKIACAIINNLRSNDGNKEEVVRRARKVIRDNLATVQKVAFLLGENASETEASLNAIVESFDSGTLHE